MHDETSIVNGGDNRKTTDIYLALRAQIFAYATRPSARSEYIALMMDWPLAKGTTTIMAGADGSASLYLSNGGAFIGGGQKYLTLRNCALAAIECARDVESLMSPATECPIPPISEISFYLVKRGHMLTVTAKESDLRQNHGPLAKLGNAAMAIMTQYRLITSQPKNRTVQ